MRRATLAKPRDLHGCGGRIPVLGKCAGRAFAPLAIAILTIACGPARAHALSADEVLQRSFLARNQGDGAFSTYRVELSTRGGSRVGRTISTFRKFCDGSLKQLVVFRAPSDVAGAAFLSWIHLDRPPDMWLYLPELGRPRQINAATRGESFLGSDFTYEDLGAPGGDPRTHAILDEPLLDGKPAFLVESRPHASDLYGRILTWVSQLTFLPIRVEYFDHDARLLKVGRWRDVRHVKGIPMAFALDMANVQTGHRTDVRLLEADYDRAFDCALFSERGLRRAAP